MRQELKQITEEELKNITIYSKQFIDFKDYPYDDWKPAKQRINFVNEFAMGESLLDIGCGFYPVTAEVKAKRKIGVDISIKAAKKSWKEFNEFHFFDPTKIDKELLKQLLGTFDTIVASELLEHLEDPKDLVEKMEYLLNDNGRILITVPNGRSIAGFIDRALHNGKFHRFKLFHRTHVSLLKTKQWRNIFEDAGLVIEFFDFRPSDLIENFPKETTKIWKTFCKIAPNFFGHQFFYVLRKNKKEDFNKI